MYVLEFIYIFVGVFMECGLMVEAQGEGGAEMKKFSSICNIPSHGEAKKGII